MRSLDPGITDRLLRRIRADFPTESELVVDLLGEVKSDGQGRERVMAAVVLAADKNIETLMEMVELSAIDWRDVLMNGGLAAADWRRLLDEQLGTAG